MTAPVRLRELLREVSKHVPLFPEAETGGRGVVMCAGGVTYLANAFVSLRYLRKVSGLPVDLFHAGPEEMPAATRARLEADFAPLTVRDITVPMLADTGFQMPVDSFRGFQIKPFALLCTRFEEVVFLDADNIALQDPEALFEAPPYLDTGALFWPDLPDARYTSPELMDLFDVSDPSLRHGPEFESGQMVLDRRRCWAALVLTALAHSDREGMREWCFAHGLGDKDVFRMAFRYSGTPYHLIEFAPDLIGTRMVEIPQPTRYPVRVQNPRGEFAPTGVIQKGLSGENLFLHKTIWEWLPHADSEQMRYRVRDDGRPEEMALLREVEAEGQGYLAEFRERYLDDFEVRARFWMRRAIDRILLLLAALIVALKGGRRADGRARPYRPSGRDLHDPETHRPS